MKKTSFLIALMLVAVSAFALSRKPFYTDAVTYMQTGQCVASSDGTVTNTFSTAFGAAPKVILTPFNTRAGLSNVVQITAVTTSNFVCKSAASGDTNFWIAVGSP